jgi:hypothetical protein
LKKRKFSILKTLMSFKGKSRRFWKILPKHLDMHIFGCRIRFWAQMYPQVLTLDVKWLF